MKELMESLARLQSIDFGEGTGKNVEAAKAELRAKIPAQVLGHYDRLVARGKKGVALVRDQVCTGCHMRLPIGVITTLMHARDIQLCDSCGRYLYLAPAAPAPAPEPEVAPKPKPARRGRKPKSA